MKILIYILSKIGEWAMALTDKFGAGVKISPEEMERYRKHYQDCAEKEKRDEGK